MKKNRIKFTYEPMPDDAEVEVIDIVRAEYVDGYRLHLWFNDGKERIVDFKPFLCQARHPDLKKYLVVDEFKKFKIVYGNLDWNDYEMCFPVADLYDGNI
jgi:hypothetical protein